MTVLRWYDIDHLEESASLLKQRLESGAIGWLGFAVAASAYCLRDARGDYWLLDAATGDWYLHDRSGWRKSNPPQGRLEGPQKLAESGVITESQLQDVDDPFVGKEVWQPGEVLEILVHRAGQDYRRGKSSSQEAESLLARLLLADHQGLFWTPGIYSGKWYRYADQGWEQMAQPPDPAQIVRWRGGPATCERCGSSVQDAYLCPNCGAMIAPGIDRLAENASAQVYRFLLLGAGTLPEPLTAPWEPPAGFPDQPETGARCDVCGASNMPGSRFCNQCGARLGCPRCGGHNPPGSRFCNHCGHALVVERGAA